MLNLPGWTERAFEGLGLSDPVGARGRGTNLWPLGDTSGSSESHS